MVINKTNAVEVSIQAVSAPEKLSANAGALHSKGNVRAIKSRLARPVMGRFPRRMFGESVPHVDAQAHRSGAGTH